LPASINVGDTITEKFDGKTIGTTVMASGGTLSRQPDGSWLDISVSTASRMRTVCASGGLNDNGVGVLVPGTHTVQFVDKNGAVLAQGSYTVTSAIKSPAVSTSPKVADSVDITPAVFSCSVPVDVTMKFDLPVHQGASITIKIDGLTYKTTRSAAGQWWTWTDTLKAATIKCQAAGKTKTAIARMFIPGNHTVQAFDAKGALLAQTSYTVNV
jgi:hypothetical protein